MPMQAVPYWRLSAFYFVYCTFLGAFMPYWSLYLKSLAFTAFQIGVLMSLFQVARIFVPTFWGWLADKTGHRVKIIQLTAAASLACYLGVFAGESFGWLLGVMALMCFFLSAPMPLIETITLKHLGEAESAYGRIRLWGSIGFIVAVIGLGYWFDYAPIKSLLWVLLGLKVGILLISRWVPEPPDVLQTQARSSVWEIVRRKEVMAFLVACFLMATAHGAYYTFYSIYLVDHGYSKSAVGWLWAMGVMCEIMVFLVMPKLTTRFGLRNILLVSFLLAALRFSVIGWGVGVPALVFFAQTLHAATFGSFHAASVAVMNRVFHGSYHARGQAIYTSVSYGLGGTFGGLLAGVLWEPLGAVLNFSLSAVVALIGFFLLWRWLKLAHDK
jgi:MFS transporter, PPP family, 3-phenylpropionic acid transporter